MTIRSIQFNRPIPPMHTKTPSAPTPLIPQPNEGQTYIRVNAALIADAAQSFSPGSLILKPHQISDNHSWQIHAVGSSD